MVRSCVSKIDQYDGKPMFKNLPRTLNIGRKSAERAMFVCVCVGLVRGCFVGFLSTALGVIFAMGPNTVPRMSIQKKSKLVSAGRLSTHRCWYLVACRYKGWWLFITPNWLLLVVSMLFQGRWLFLVVLVTTDVYIIYCSTHTLCC